MNRHKSIADKIEETFKSKDGNIKNFKEMIYSWAFSPYIEHEDFTKCGQCLREKIKSEISVEYLKSNRTEKEDLVSLLVEVELKWKESELYKKVTSLKESGLSLPEALIEIKKQGYIP